MSMFKDDAERNKFLLEQSSIILAGLLSAPDERYVKVFQQLLGYAPTKPTSLIDIQSAIFSDMQDRFKDA